MKEFNSRIDMLSELPKNSKMLEIGSFNGDFAFEINKKCNPDWLILVDTWNEKIFSADQHGANPKTISGKSAIDNIRKVLPNAILIRSTSEKFLSSPEIYSEFFDFIYIDANHKYQAVKNDIELSWQYLKPGGFLAGHDYTLNYNNIRKYHGSAGHYDRMGVQQAVNEFLEEKNIQLFGIALDGYTSFLIKKI